MGWAVPGVYLNEKIHRDNGEEPLSVEIEMGEPPAECQPHHEYFTQVRIVVYDGRNRVAVLNGCWSRITISGDWLYFAKQFQTGPNHFVQVVRWRHDGSPHGVMEVLGDKIRREIFDGFELEDDELVIHFRS